MKRSCQRAARGSERGIDPRRLSRDRDPHLAASERPIHEAALRMQLGGPKVVADQLAHLLRMSERNNITLQVLPFGAEEIPRSGQPICYVHGPVAQLDTVQLDSFHGSVFVDSEADLLDYRRLLDEAEKRSLSRVTREI
ncbi:DUF5753 domain-containing protein [Streptomyces sp. ET3-23]|uniref:Scr1 family TA system antitoxin-like transcriptional regulator n=1 Tax=Streptomyces sp. ET3-23 TaxID=2885643 RepID=UPI001D12D7A1|nr:Scr1 family TA system antitoxin-like transcriptional regulator [Streptomyces sp. ET3-23]MCC2280614.1 DUF5753 domain-containing protein [Streptomyces sp. ET3-23]